jgi:hypothetical protein
MLYLTREYGDSFTLSQRKLLGDRDNLENGVINRDLFISRQLIFDDRSYNRTLYNTIRFLFKDAFSPCPPPSLPLPGGRGQDLQFEILARCQSIGRTNNAPFSRLLISLFDANPPQQGSQIRPRTIPHSPSAPTRLLHAPAPRPTLLPLQRPPCPRTIRRARGRLKQFLVLHGLCRRRGALSGQRWLSMRFNLAGCSGERDVRGEAAG